MAPILLEKPITLYDAAGQPLRSYNLELGDVIKENGKVLFQHTNQWNDYFRGLGGGINQLTLPEAYAAIEQMQETKHPGLEGFFQDLTTNGLILNTQFDYHNNIITHRLNDNDKVEIRSSIPEESGKMEGLIQASYWRDAVQRMLLCKDVEKAVEVLSIASGRVPYLFTPSYESRSRYPVRTAWFGCDSNYLYLNGYDDLYNDFAARLVRRASVSEQEAPAGRSAEKTASEERIFQPVTKELILPIAQSYISGYDWKTFSERIPDQAPALGDVLLAAHKDHFVCDFARPEFDEKMRGLYFPTQVKK